MQENIILDETNTPEGYQLMIVNIKWDKETIGKYRSKKDFSDKLPDQMSVILPESLARKENTPDFNDTVETWVYNFLAKRFNHIAHYCQIWLPVPESTEA